RLLTHLGFEALATSSAVYAFSIGKPDNAVGRDAMLAHAASVAAATDLPISIDLENGFGDAPEFVAETIRLAADTGAAGGSIEDATERADNPIYERSLAVERIRAAADVIRDLPFPFTLTARCENYLVGRPDLKDTIERLQMYQEAGADVLYAPGLTTKDDIEAVVSAVDRPVNVLMGLKGVELSLAELSAIGVKRISVGSALARCALTALLRGAREMKEHGTFHFADDAEPFRAINSLF
ncbi:MAG TPA: isocitrate lyase/phosphoenolpyruvate mutase family protein, partial [Pyrinomonadaceae bacterium]|nr:isocitrate lyase/phosphoenolpyruvate mutase family protein [Pyrinomonadaceae bacterium]